MDWVEDIDRQTRFLWLYGPAGAGKSAIEQTTVSSKELPRRQLLFLSQCQRQEQEDLPNNNNRRSAYRVDTRNSRACW